MSPPRVLHIGKYFPPYRGGIENFSGELLSALTRLGVEVGALIHRLGRRGGIEYSRVPGADRGFPIYACPTYGQWMYAPVAPAFRRWFGLALREFRPHILHLHLPNTSAFWALTLARARPLPWVLHWHADVAAAMPEDRLFSLLYQLYRWPEQRLLQRARAVIATSPTYLDSSPTLTPWRDKCAVIPLGLPAIPEVPATGADQEWAEAIWPSRDCRVFCVGRMTYYKGQDVLLRALQGTRGLQAILVGEGERLERLKTLSRELRLESRVSFPGAVSAGRLQALMEHCDLLCLPSIDRSEAFGLVLLEAMRAGKPVIASRVPGSGMGWVVDDGVTGRLVPPGDSEALRLGLEQLAAEPIATREMGRRGAQAFAARFRIEVVAEQVRRLYEKISD